MPDFSFQLSAFQILQAAVSRFHPLSCPKSGKRAAVLIIGVAVLVIALIVSVIGGTVIIIPLIVFIVGVTVLIITVSVLVIAVTVLMIGVFVLINTAPATINTVSVLVIGVAVLVITVSVLVIGVTVLIIGATVLVIGVVVLINTVTVFINKVMETIIAEAVFIVENQGGKRLFWQSCHCPARICAGVRVLAGLKVHEAGTIKWTDNQQAPGVLDLQPLVNRVQREAKVLPPDEPFVEQQTQNM